MKVLTNHHPRPIIYGYELTEKEREEFDYIKEWDTTEEQFVRYKGELYDLGEFMTTADVHKNWDSDHPFVKWDGYQSNTFFSGILIKYTPDQEHVIVGRYYN